ncbi:cytochrome P450 [Reyranella sp. CPCC 100927]|uniref:cytochrome P450 n=1 Tax=Reyranella sp. CPCC 100927 TaxID=2599616 RepID=UPI0011B81FDA|nr:cytochrome P450 [Reyranella sp. CPCC 100927]TWS99678.1 cytochrome P450 [Reyranella sp. CPCC 100927]
MPPPSDAIAAVTHADPYPYYAALVAQRPFYRDDKLGLWVASSAAAVDAVLACASGRVRPPAEPVPQALVGSPAGDIFRHLVRMNDGAGHCPFKQAVAATLSAVDDIRVAAVADLRAQRLVGTMALNDVVFALPAHVVGSLLGVPDDRLPQLAQWAGDFVRSIAPGADTTALARGNVAARQLLAMFHDMLARARDSDGLLARLAHDAGSVGRPAADVIVANSIGFLSQTYDATAGLIGNTLVTLARHPELQACVEADPGRVRAVVGEVLRYDPSVHNTRRFMAADTVIAGQALTAHDAVLVVLAAAGRDPAANPDPARLDLARQHIRLFTFGAGVHACPGERVAATIAQAAVTRLIATGVRPPALLDGLAYRPSGNVRIPLFAADA